MTNRNMKVKLNLLGIAVFTSVKFVYYFILLGTVIDESQTIYNK